MTWSGSTDSGWWPYIVSGLGVLFALMLIGDGVAVLVVRGEFTAEYVVGVLTGGPFVVELVYGGYWVRRSDISPERYRRVVGWCLGTLTGFLLVNGLLMVVIPPTDAFQFVAWTRWAASIGGGVGLVVGVFESRAIDREVAAERRRARAAELRRQNERLEEFASLISHDLRNPLNVAIGRVDLARKGEGDVGDHLDATATSLDRMEDIVERTLELARSGRVIGETEPVDLAVVADQCWDSVETDRAVLRVEDPPVVGADSDRVRHLLENLFGNAVEHGSTSPDSHPQQDAVERGSASPDSQAQEDSAERRSAGSRTRSDDAGSDVTVRVGGLPNGIYVADDGPGIPEDERDAVFDAGYSTDPDGSGFGLSIVEQIAVAHGWEVAVTESEEGGARFEFTGTDQ